MRQQILLLLRRHVEGRRSHRSTGSGSGPQRWREHHRVRVERGRRPEGGPRMLLLLLLLLKLLLTLLPKEEA